MKSLFTGFEKRAEKHKDPALANYIEALKRKKAEYDSRRKLERKDSKKEFKAHQENKEKVADKDNRPALVYEGRDPVGGKKMDAEREKQDIQVQNKIDKNLQQPEPEQLVGGMGDNMPDEAFNQRQLRRGQTVESEHTEDPGMAEEIAKDHLAEDPKYYNKLEKMEAGQPENKQIAEEDKETQKVSSFLGKRAAKAKEVAVVAVIKDGKMLMGKRRDNGRWTNPGGHLEEGEQPLQGAIRELQEETGIVASPHQLSHLTTEDVTKSGGQQYRIHAYKLNLGDKTPTSMKNDPDGEVLRWHWVNADGNNNSEIYSNLHVPASENVLLKALGMTQQKTASFYDAYYQIFGGSL